MRSVLSARGTWAGRSAGDSQEGSPMTLETNQAGLLDAGRLEGSGQQKQMFKLTRASRREQLNPVLLLAKGLTFLKPHLIVSFGEDNRWYTFSEPVAKRVMPSIGSIQNSFLDIR